jgi:3-oxosteroid 1-dehydrogenase
MTRLVDLVVVGAGAGGLVAAITAKARGLDVLLVEKSEWVGGTSALSHGGLWFPDNPVMRAAGIHDSVDDGLTYLQAVVGDFGPAATKERQEAYIRGARRMVPFLQGEGLKFVLITDYPDYYPEAPGGTVQGRMLDSPLFDARELERWPERVRPRPGLPGGLVMGTVEEFRELFLVARSRRARAVAAKAYARTLAMRARGVKPLVLGGAYIGQLLLAAQHRRVAFQLRSPMRDLLVPGGRVAGIVVEGGGRREEIHSRHGVLLSAGGFAHNHALRAEHGPAPTAIWSYAVPEDTGDAFTAATKLGAATAALDEAFYLPGLVGPDGNAQLMVAERHLPGSILVDASGARFTNESKSYMELGRDMYARHQVSAAVPSWLIIDTRHRNRYPLGMVMPRVPPKAWLASGHLKKSATLDGLARQCGIDPSGLTATVSRFNALAQTGNDQDFGRGASAYDRTYGDPGVWPNPCLGPLDKPPFYAAKLVPADVGMAGGLLTDEHAQVLDGDGAPIPGLWACGNTAASSMGHVYPGGGISLGQSSVFGFVAAESITEAATTTA